MITKKVASREIGRPRSFTDDDVFAAMARAVARFGYARLTIEAVATEVGCSGPALIGRFGSKRGLMLAYFERSREVALARFETAQRSDRSPLEALRARFSIPTDERPDEVGSPSAYINLLLFHLAAWEDPELRALEAQRQRMFEDQIAVLLQEACNAGELADCAPRGLARLLLAAMTGTALQWAADPDGDIGERLVEVIDEVVEPYRPRG
jgi:AcrR family transcriptional regulator